MATQEQLSDFDCWALATAATRSCRMVGLSRASAPDTCLMVRPAGGDWRAITWGAFAAQIRKALVKRGGGVGLRLAVKTSGCSGYAYALEFADAPTPEDLSFDTEGVKLLVDPMTMPMIDNVTVDFVDTLTHTGFKFDNPNASSQCSCGSSFSV